MRHDGGSLPLAGFSDSAVTSKSTPTPTGPSPQELAAQARAEQVTALNAALKKYAATVPEFSVAVLDKKTGQKFSYRGTETYDTASVVKVQVLACLLMTAQNKGRDLTSTELALAKRMIRLSDNDATTSLFNKLGKNSAVQACDKRLGLTQTKVNSAWGLTRTTVDDQVKLLSQLVSTSSPLDAESRKLAFTLMNSVDESQEWGVPAAAEPGDVFTVKNGWDTRTSDNGRWVVNSVGRITGPSTDVSVAVLSHGHPSMAAGIAVVEKVAKMTRQYLKY
ncbi:MAG TPA: serine hydrolase [Actinoplanes sp.]|jgi:beta-lactamase class A